MAFQPPQFGQQNGQNTNQQFYQQPQQPPNGAQFPPQGYSTGFGQQQPPINGHQPQYQNNQFPGYPQQNGQQQPFPVKPIPQPLQGSSAPPPPQFGTQNGFSAPQQPPSAPTPVPSAPTPQPFQQAPQQPAAQVAPFAQPPSQTPSVPQAPSGQGQGQFPQGAAAPLPGGPGRFTPGALGPQPGGPQQGSGAPGGFPPGQGAPAPQPGGFQQGLGASQQGSFPPGPGSSAPQPGNFHQTPGNFPPGPPTSQQSQFHGAPGASAPQPGGFLPAPAAPGSQPGGFQQGPGGFPPGPGVPGPQQGGFQQGPGAFPPGPGAQGYPGQPSQFPPGPGGFPAQPSQYPQAPGGFPGQQNPGFPPGPGPSGAFKQPPGGFGPTSGYPGPPQQPQQRLDPNMMPSAVQVMEDDNVRTGVFPTGYPYAEMPPLVSTKIFAQDQGNCNPKLMRSTMYVAPQSNDVLKAAQIPFAVSVSPFAALAEGERQPPVIDLGPQGPIRCMRCKAYICPFMEFMDGGRKFRCPFCHVASSVEDAYFAHLDHTGRRTDIEMRPELFLGAYDFVATKQYCRNGVPPKQPAYLFMIDVSYNSSSIGMLQILCQNLDKVLQSLPKETGQSESSIHIGLATFDQAVHFFDLTSPQPKMLVMNDVQEPFTPFVEGLLLPYSEAISGLRAALAEIPRLFSTSKTTETILLPVVQAGLDALQSADRAGKLLVFTTSLPSFEAPGKLKTKNERTLLGTDKEKPALIPQEESYTKLGEKCVKAGVTVDLFLFPNAFIDVATIGQLAAVTGGSIFKYQYFNGERDGSRFLNELRRHASKQIGFDCMVRVRTSTGLRPINYYGALFMENSTDLEFATLDENKAFFAEIKHDDKLSEQSAMIQTAVLYTSTTGQRRLRILNMCLPVSADFNQLYRVTDSDTLTALLLKQAVQLNRDKGNKEMRDQLAQRCAHFLATYREKCSESSPLGQLILPETLKLMPLYVNSIIKNDAVSGASEMTVDDKVWQMELVRSLRVEDALPLIYPRVYPVSELEVNDPADLATLPPCVRASYDFMDNKKAYIIDNGVVLFVWIGLGVAEAWAQDVFGAASVAMIDTEKNVIPEKDNAKSRALRRCIQLLPRSVRARKTFIVVEKSGLEPWMRKFLVEDKASPTNMSYVDFLCYIHREIRNILS